MKFMKFQNVFFIVIIMMILIGPQAVASPKWDFLLSICTDRDFEEHFNWCLDYKITTEARLNLTIPDNNQLDDFVYLLTTYFEPHDRVPHQRLVLGIESTHGQGDATYNWDDIQNFITERESDVIDWLQDLSQEVIEVYGLNPMGLYPLRFRFFNEVNTFEYFTPEDCYKVLHWFYPLFKEHGPRGATLVISLSGSESEGTWVDYRNYLRGMLAKHFEMYYPNLPNNTLPFDGIDVHAGTTQYNAWSGIYQNLRSVFQEVLGTHYGNQEFDRMLFWALETTRFPRGLCETVWSWDTFEYGSDWDAARYAIKTITHTLNIPDVEFITLPNRKRPEWNKRYPDGLFQMTGLYDHGCHIYDRGTRTPSHALEPLRRLTNYLWNYYPDTQPSTVFSTSNVRRYQFKTPNNKYRLVVWRDHGNRPMEDVIIILPYTYMKSVVLIDLISGHQKIIPTYGPDFFKFVRIDLCDNPLVITPTNFTGIMPYRIISPHIRSDITNAAFPENGTWESTLHLFNPEFGDQFIEIHAYDSNGVQVGSPYESMIPAHGAMHLPLGSVYPPFEGSLSVLSSGHIIGQVNHVYQAQDETGGVVSFLTPLPFPEQDALESDTRYLSTDWEISPVLRNWLSLANIRDSESSAWVTIYDESGMPMSEQLQTLGAHSQTVTEIAGDQTEYRYGMIEVETEPGVTGQMTRYSTGGHQPFWTETALMDDDRMVSELEIKAGTITDAESYSRVIVTNPWAVSVSGVIREYDNADALVAETMVSLDAFKTLELVLNAPTVSAMTFNVENDMHVLARRDDMITEPDDQTITSVSSRSVKPDYYLARRLVIPYFIHDTTSGQLGETVVNIRNDNDFRTSVALTLFETSGDVISRQVIPLDPESITRVMVADILPDNTVSATGSITMDISQVGGITAEADYTIQINEQGETMSMSAVFQQIH